ncbi:MAG: ATPase, T2SS/T4P/T4SS family [Candidatus Baltobacteraceae bacterium]
MTETLQPLSTSPTQRTAAALLSRSFAYDADVLPISYDGGALTVGVPTDSLDLVDKIRQQTRKEVRTVILPVREIREALKTLYPAIAARDADSQASVSLDEIFASAIGSYASDLHLEPRDGRSGRVRLDIDGVLQHDRNLEPGLFERVVSLVKVRSNMNTGETRLPQDGRLTVTFDGRSFDVRVSTIPVGGLEKVVLRFLQRFDLVPDLEQLGMGSELLARYQRALKRPGSFCVNAGPTGSGKSTTIASLLDRLNATEAKHIMTFEDPVEYTHEWLKSVVTQYEVGRDIATFADGVRGSLRADPDVLFIGELRGLETASAALQAAETGHLVFAALHTPSETPLAINRIIGLFPSEEQERARTRLADALRALVGLRLLPLREGNGLRAAAEIVIASEAVRRIIRDGATHQLRATIASSRKDGMQTLESHLSELVSSGDVELGAARAASLYPEEVRELPAGSFRRR